MRYQLAFLVTFATQCAICSAVRAADSPTWIRIQPDWKVGERVHLQYDRMRESYVPDTESQIVHSRVPVDVEVLEIREEGFLLSVRFGKTAFIPPNPEWEKIVNRFKPVPQRILLSRGGAILALENWKELREQAVAIVQSANAGTAEDKGQFDAAAERVMTMYGTQEMAMAVFTKDIAGYFMPIGIDVAQGEPVEESHKISNPIGGDPLSGKSKLTAIVDPQNNQRILATYDFRYGDSVGEVAWEVTGELSDNKDALKGEPIPKIVVRDQTDAVYDRVREWVVESEHTRTVIIGEVKKIDRRTWKLVPK